MTDALRYAEAEDGTALAFRVRGSGPPIVLLGATIFGGMASQDPMPQPARGQARVGDGLQETHSVLVLDSRGTGRSDVAEAGADLNTEINDVMAVLDAAGFDRADVFAISPSAAVGVGLAALEPERVNKLVLLNPLIAPTRESMFAPRRRLILDLAMIDWEYFADLWVFARIGFDTSPDHAHVLSRNIRQLMTPERFSARLRAVEGWDASEFVSRVNVPTLVLHDPNTPFLPSPTSMSRDLATLIPGAHFAVAPQSDDPGWGSDKWQLSQVLSFLGSRSSGLPEGLPSGFQTVLFTDLESSTAVTQRLGDEGAQELLRSHNRAVREALRANSGHEVKHTGDGIMASFASAVSAVTAALQIQALLTDASVRVRIGVNAGEPITEEDDLFGTVVQLAARITDRAEPGQVLVSNVIRELCAGKGFIFEDAGEQTLKGFEEPVRLFVANVPD
jgi:class 3 adenylate cyclase/pimeloyl-ACP methyl ester carboxylesterase